MLKKSSVRFAVAAVVVIALLSSLAIRRSDAQQPSARITRAIDNSARFVLAGSRPPRIQAATDLGRMDSSTSLRGISIVFSRSIAQEAGLKKLIADQQNPDSPLYHKWLSPDEFGARFGLAQSDLGQVQAWLQQQGFTVDSISRSRNSIRFSGTVGRVESAFGTEMHNYRVGSENHFAPAREISVPAALSSVVLGVGNLSTLIRPRPHVRKPQANFTSNSTGNHFLTPKDVATIYNINNPDINSAVGTGFNGAGQAIAIVGQSSVALSDLENFQKAAGLTVKDPILVLVPGSGDVEESSGDEAESDLDLEYSSGIATGASIYFVYVGNDQNFNVFDSIIYAVETRIAPIISTSYGICETALATTDFQNLDAIMSQASSQGQTVVAAAGDTGSTDCAGVGGLSTAQQQALAVDYPASSQFVTGMGGNEFPNADVCSPQSCTTSAPFWTAANGSDVISSATQHIPEQVWNDDSTASTSLSSGGGGISTLTATPSWQNTNVPGITAVPSHRLVPDISLAASPVNVAYLFCSSDVGFTGVTGSCSNNTFRDINNSALTGAGGTSFDAPIFAGLMALIDEKENSTGQGVVNPILYSLASNSGTYSSAFHDITSGDNKCRASACSPAGAGSFAAATGYDEASGLGSLIFSSLLAAWPANCPSCSSKAGSTTALSAATNTPAVGISDAITITVTPGSGTSPAPTGSVQVSVDGGSPSSVTLSAGTGTFNFTPAAVGSHVITALYSGDSTYAASTGTLVVDNQAFRITATDVTVTAGNSGTSTITITPQEGYTGTIKWSVASSTSIANACFSISNSTVSGTSQVTATLNLQTSSAGCSSAALVPASATRTEVASATAPHPPVRSKHAPIAAAVGLLFAGVLISGSLNSRKLWTLIGLLLLTAMALLAAGCGSSSKPAVVKAIAGTYTLTVTGTDSSISSIGAAATLTLKVN